MIKVKDDGIYNCKQYLDFDDSTIKYKDELIITKEAFIESYKKWIEEPLAKELIEYKKQLESEDNNGR